MVAAAFRGHPSGTAVRALDPGCGAGAITSGIIRYCEQRGFDCPSIDAVEADPQRIEDASSLEAHPSVRVLRQDFLRDMPLLGSYDLVVGNPPYVPITSMTGDEKSEYRHRFVAATGRFDLYFLFFEEALRLLRPGGRLVFLTPEKYLGVQSARALRRLLAGFVVEEIEFLPEDTFGKLMTYPVLTVVKKIAPAETDLTTVRSRDGQVARQVNLPSNGDSWIPAVRGATSIGTGRILADVTARVSAGVATGADRLFTLNVAAVPIELRAFAHPTISGRELSSLTDRTVMRTEKVLLSPYRRDGTLMSEREAAPLLRLLSEESRARKLRGRTCVTRKRSPKPWYAFHETPPPQCLLPKLLCRDLAKRPEFWIDRTGEIVPQHSVYYIVPRPGVTLDELCEYLNGDVAADWVRAHSQSASHGFLRLQSRVLRALPVPSGISAGNPDA